MFVWWDVYFRYDVCMESFAESGIDPHFMANRQKAYVETLAWDHIDCCVTKAYNKKEDRLSREGTCTADCHQAPCTMCQACDRFVLEGIGLKAAAKGKQILPLTTA